MLIESERFDLFRTGITRCAQVLTVYRQLLALQFGDPEIQNLDPALLGHHQIMGLDIHVMAKMLKSAGFTKQEGA